MMPIITLSQVRRGRLVHTSRCGAQELRGRHRRMLQATHRSLAATSSFTPPTAPTKGSRLPPDSLPARMPKRGSSSPRRVPQGHRYRRHRTLQAAGQPAFLPVGATHHPRRGHRDDLRAVVGICLCYSMDMNWCCTCCTIHGRSREGTTERDLDVGSRHVPRAPL